MQFTRTHANKRHNIRKGEGSRYEQEVASGREGLTSALFSLPEFGGQLVVSPTVGVAPIHARPPGVYPFRGLGRQAGLF